MWTRGRGSRFLVTQIPLPRRPPPPPTKCSVDAPIVSVTYLVQPYRYISGRSRLVELQACEHVQTVLRGDCKTKAAGRGCVCYRYSIPQEERQTERARLQSFLGFGALVQVTSGFLCNLQSAPWDALNYSVDCLGAQKELLHFAALALAPVMGYSHNLAKGGYNLLHKLESRAHLPRSDTLSTEDAAANSESA